MNRTLILRALACALVSGGIVNVAAASIGVSPGDVNVNANGASVVLLTFGPLTTQEPAEACWCGDLIPVPPSLGLRCNPATTWGCLPARSDFSKGSGKGGLTDIMTIPSSVAMRAYRSAARGAPSTYFYVRRFVDTAGGPDEYVAVTCRMGSAGAKTPFALTDVKLSFGAEETVLMVSPDRRLPAARAEITYNGTGRLRGRWEVVKPGEDPPSEQDLLTEATLPAEDRGSQRRYTQVATFNQLLPPTGRFLLTGPDFTALPDEVAGSYLLLLRIESTDDAESDSDLAAVGVGTGTVHSGGAAGFAIPPLRYFVEGGAAGPWGEPALLEPAENDVRSAGRPVDFTWSRVEDAAFYRLEVEEAPGSEVLSALALPGNESYRSPDWLGQRIGEGDLRWRVITLDRAGATMSASPWRHLRLRNADRTAGVSDAARAGPPRDP